MLNDGHSKIADFGFAKDLTMPPCKFYYSVGSPWYMSPQALKQNIQDYDSDIWSIGITYYELLVGSVPWKANTE